MQKTDTMSFPALNQVKGEGNFVQVWIDSMLNPPYLLVLCGDADGNCQVYDPAESYSHFD